MRLLLAQAIVWFANLLTTILLIRCIFSWFRPNPYGFLGKLNELTISITEPIVAPCRALLSRFNTGMFDFSVLLAFFLIEFVRNVLIQILL